MEKIRPAEMPLCISSFPRIIFSSVLPLFLLLALLFISGKIIAQSHYPGMYLVSFTDKTASPFSVNKPEAYLSPKALERRQKAGIEVSEEDFPPNPFYIDSLVGHGAKAVWASRWLNAVLVRMDDSLKMLEIEALPFVDSLAYMAPVKKPAKQKAAKKHNKRINTTLRQAPEHIDYGYSWNQLHLIGLDELHAMGLLGEGITIAVLDNGFSGMKKMPVFDMLFDNGQIKGTKDFATPGGDVFNAGTHGTYVMTTMAAFEEGVLVGSAPAADYWLIHTEDNTFEYPVEEFNWAVGAEFADSAGADIITSSLIYSRFDDTLLNHTHAQLDGKTAIVSRAAQTATEKGILVFNSAGNDARKPWRTIAFPADAKDVITTGAVNQDGVYAPFSSVGYTVDGRVKPDVTAVGQGTVSVSISSGKIIHINGTSFSNPTMAGAVAVLRQANPEASTSAIRDALRRSASHYSKPDSLTGYGIPNLYLAHILLNNNEIGLAFPEEEIKIFPNPVGSEHAFVLFNVPDEQTVELRIIDESNKLFWQSGEVPVHSGLNILRLQSVDSLSQGLYILILQTDDKTLSRKFIR